MWINLRHWQRTSQLSSDLQESQIFLLVSKFLSQRWKLKDFETFSFDRVYLTSHYRQSTIYHIRQLEWQKNIFFLLSQDWFRMWWKMRKKVLWWNMWDIVADGIYPIYFYIIHIGWLYPLLSKIVGMNLINFQLIWRILDGFLAKTLMI